MFDIINIKSPDFIKDLSIKELKILASEIRDFLIENVSKTGGHLASNLGVVEITLAMFYVFDPKKDKFLYDVGHQSYVHKILTGRAKDFVTLRKFGGLSGYTSPKESEFDFWESAHSSNTISAMAGMLLTNNDDSRVVTVIGDSSINNGVAFEGINFTGEHKELSPIIILNDNNMSISKSVGSFADNLIRLRTSKFYKNFKKFLNLVLPRGLNNIAHVVKRGIKNTVQKENIFESMGLDYFGPINGHDIKHLITTFERAIKIGSPILIHCLTEKGKGYALAENDKTGYFHGVPPFDVNTGQPLTLSNPNKSSFSQIVSDYLCYRRSHSQFFLITPAMIMGQKLSEFEYLYGDSLLDVGINESHATTMAAGMAVNHADVVLLMYSTFAQRAYDQLLNDICRQDLKVIIGIDRAGIVGSDGSTHEGVYDVAMFNHMPNVKVAMPSNPTETWSLFEYAFKQNKAMVIRYPRNSIIYKKSETFIEEIDEKWKILHEGSKAIVISYGPDLNRILNIIKSNNLDVTLVNAMFIKPIDKVTVKSLVLLNLPILVYEEVVTVGALSSSILNYVLNSDLKLNKFHTLGFDPNTYITHGSIPEVLNEYGLGDEDILKEIKNLIGE